MARSDPQQAPIHALPKDGTTVPKEPKVVQRHEPAKVKLPDVPRLGPPAGTTPPHMKPLPEPPRVPDVHPKATAPTAKGTARTLPVPEDIIRHHQPAPTPKTPPKKGKGG